MILTTYKSWDDPPSGDPSMPMIAPIQGTAEPSELERQCSVTSAVSAVSVGSRESESRGSLNGDFADG